MIKWIITSRHGADLTTERFYYEWSVIHVALMLTNASTMRNFRRYVQHYAYLDVPAAARVLPQHPMAWESFAEHWVESYANIVSSIGESDYRGRLFPHRFSDTAMELHLVQGETVYQRADFRSGGVKLLHALKAASGVSLADFERDLVGRHAPLVARTLEGHGLRKYVVDRQLHLDPATFKGSLFEHGGVDLYAGIEELWFDRLEDALRVGQDPATRQALGASYAHLADTASSHSMYVVERVVFDFVSPGEAMPAPAVIDPDSLEARTSDLDWTRAWPALGKSLPAATASRRS